MAGRAGNALRDRPARRPPRERTAGVLAFFLMAVNLRIAIAAVSPVLPQIQRQLAISSAVAGLVTTIPVACFGIFAFAVPTLRRRARPEPLLAAVVTALVGGIVLRLQPSLAAFFGGTVVIGAAIAVGNVLLPSIVKEAFARRATLMTGLYSMGLNAGSALSAGLTVPLESSFGGDWRAALAFWAAPAALALAVWLAAVVVPHRRQTLPLPTSAEPSPDGVARLWREPLAWAVTGFMGLQSIGFYATVAWVPTIFEDHGLKAGTAGWLLSFSIFPAMLASLAAPYVARRLRHQWIPVVCAVSCCAVAYAALGSDPVPLAYLWMTLLGIGQGASISLALGYIVLRSPDPAHTGQLSMMAQGCGYLFACLGPFALGALHDVASDWALPLGVLGVLLAPQLVAGLQACRNRHVGAGQRARAG